MIVTPSGFRARALARRALTLALALALTALSALLLPAPRAAAQDADYEVNPDQQIFSAAQEHIIQAQRALDRGDLTAALASFQRAQQLAPDVKNLISIADLHQRRGDCPSAYAAWTVALRECADCKYKDMIFGRFVEGTRPCTLPLTITSMPSAQVRLDGVELWRTPVQIPALHGTHTVELSELGYVSVAQRVLVDPSQERADLDVILYLVSSAQGARLSAPAVDWTPPPSPPASAVRSVTALGFLAVGVVGAGVSAGMVVDRQISAATTLSLSAISALFVIGGLVLLP